MKREELFSAIGDVDDELLTEFERAASKKRRSWLPWAASAACLALLLGALLRLWGAEPEQAARRKENRETPSLTASEELGPTPAGQLPALIYGKDGQESSMDIGYPKGYFIRELSEAAIAGIWGQETLCWEGLLPSRENGYTVDGEVIYDGEGRPWVVQLHVGDDSDDTLLIELSPGHLPPSCIAQDGGATCSVYGVPVSAYEFKSYATISFLYGEGKAAVGARISLYGTLEHWKELAARIVSQSLREDGGLQLLSLATNDIPVWRSEELTEEEAYGEFGAYLPKEAPLAFECAWRELGEGRNWLNVSWMSGHQSLNVTVDQDAELHTLVHVDETEAYVWDYYGTEKPEVPEVYFDTWQDPIFYREELSMQVIESRLHGTEGLYSGQFGVLYPDGTVVHVYVYAENAKELLSFLLP